MNGRGFENLYKQGVNIGAECLTGSPAYGTAFTVLCRFALYQFLLSLSYCSSPTDEFRVNVQQYLPVEQIFKTSISISESHRHKLKPTSLRARFTAVFPISKSQTLFPGTSVLLQLSNGCDTN